MRKYIILVIIMASFVFASHAKAFTEEETIGRLQATINSLTAQLASMQAQLDSMLENQPDGGLWDPITVNLAVGSDGGAVRLLQEFLKSRGFYTGVVTGYFGATTKEAVIKYQAAKGMPATGYVGPQTRAKINAEMKVADPISNGSCIGVTPSVSDIKLQSNVNAVTVPTKSVYVGDSVKIEWQGRCLDTFNVTLRDIKGKEVYKTIAENTLKNGAIWIVSEADYNNDEYVIIHVETADGKYKSTTGKIAISKKSANTQSFLNIDRVKFNKNTGVLDVTWKYSGISRLDTRMVAISLSKGDVSISNGIASRVELKDQLITKRSASFNIADYAKQLGKKIEGDYVVRVECLGLTSSSCEADGYDIETVNFSMATSAGVESSIISETRITNLSSTRTLRPGSYETVYGAMYRVSPQPVTVERIDVRLDNLTNNRPSTDYIDSIQLLDSNQKSIATVRSVDFDQDEINKSGLRFTGVKYRLEDNKGLYLRVNTKASFPEKAEFNLYIPENGIRFVDGTAVSETFGKGLVKFKVSFEPSIVVNQTGSIPLNSPLYQKVEIVLPNGVKQTFMEKSGTNPAPLLTSMDKVTVAQGSTVTVNGKNLVVGGENMVFIDTLKGATYQVNAQALNNADGGQRITFTVDSTWNPGQYYVYVLNKNGTSNYRGLTIMSAQGANAYSGLMDALNYIQGQLSR